MSHLEAALSRVKKFASKFMHLIEFEHSINGTNIQKTIMTKFLFNFQVSDVMNYPVSLGINLWSSEANFMEHNKT